MTDWIRELITDVASGLRGLTVAVWQRLTWVYNVFVGVLTGIRRAWDNLYSRGAHFLNNVFSAAIELYYTLQWAVTVYIPQYVSARASALLSFLVSLIDSVRRYAQNIVQNIATWLSDRIQSLKTFATQAIHWIQTQINSIVDTLTRTVRIVFTLLTDPKRLASWVIDSIISEFMRWLDRNADRLFLTLRRRVIGYTVMFADRFEDMLRRLL